MKVEFDTEEAWGLMSYVVSQLLESAELSDADRARIRRWKSEEMRAASQELRVLMQKINDDLTKVAERKSKSRLRKPDWN